MLKYAFLRPAVLPPRRVFWLFWQRSSPGSLLHELISYPGADTATVHPLGRRRRKKQKKYGIRHTVNFVVFQEPFSGYKTDTKKTSSQYKRVMLDFFGLQNGSEKDHSLPGGLWKAFLKTKIGL